MAIYHCPDCGKQVNKEGFGYPVCCGATMRQGPSTAGRTIVTQTTSELWNMVAELDKYCADNEVTDWELSFIAEMHEKLIRTGYTPGQAQYIVRLWEKYCV